MAMTSSGAVEDCGRSPSEKPEIVELRVEFQETKPQQGLDFKKVYQLTEGSLTIVPVGLLIFRNPQSRRP